MRRYLVAIAFGSLVVGCARSTRDHAYVQRQLADRGASAAGADGPGESPWTDGLDEREAVAVALGRSPSYRADLTRLDSAQADLKEARRPANPQLTLVNAFGPISAFATLLAPLESLWQAPRRSAAAARAAEAVAESLVQSGLDLARDARVAHVNRGLAEDRLRVRGELADIAARLSTLGEERLRLGEASPPESAALRAEAALAVDAREQAAADLKVSRAQLRTVLGLDTQTPGFDIVPAAAPPAPPEMVALLRIARRFRPDVQAAELSFQAALERVGWERSRVVALAAHMEGHWTRSSQTRAARVGGRLELPLFGANPGGIGRAKAEVMRTHALLEALRQRVSLEIIQARTSATQAQASLALYRSDVLPSLDEARRLASAGYELGEESYVVVLDVMRRTAEARLREAELTAQARRAHAELERAVGAQIGGTP